MLSRQMTTRHGCPTPTKRHKTKANYGITRLANSNYRGYTLTLTNSQIHPQKKTQTATKPSSTIHIKETDGATLPTTLSHREHAFTHPSSHFAISLFSPLTLTCILNIYYCLTEIPERHSRKPSHTSRLLPCLYKPTIPPNPESYPSHPCIRIA